MSSVLIVLRIAGIIFAVEGLIMLVPMALPPALDAVAPRSEWLLAALDAIVLVMLSSPLVHLWVIRPYVLARAATESGLRESERRLNEAQRIAHIGSWELDLRVNILTWSDEIYRMFEIDPARFGASYEAFLDAIHPSDRDMVDKAYKSSLANRTPYDITHRLRMPDGRIKWVHERCETDFDADGKPLASRGTVQDVTERILAEAAMRENEKSLNQAQRVAKLAHWKWCFTARRLTSWSGEFPAIFGIAGEDVDPTNEGQYHLVHPDDRENLATVYEAATPERPHFDVQYRIVRNDGEVRHVREMAEPEIDREGRVVANFGIIQDVTKQVQAEEALRKKERILQERVSDLEAAHRKLKDQESVLISLTTRLEAARDSAEAASRAKSEFLASMSHELRTPLNAIIGFSEIMSGEMFGPLGRPAYKDYAEDILHSGTHLLRIVNDILDVSKAEAGMLNLADDVVDLGQVVEDCLRLVRARAEQKTVAIETDLPDAPLRVSGDRLRLKQILLNLLSNAVKFTPAGSVRVTLRAAEAQGVILQVADTGIGVAERDLARVMEPFTQVESSLSRSHEGTGLGLPLSRVLVELHGGELSLDSVLGEGTVATVRLPAGRWVKAEDAA